MQRSKQDDPRHLTMRESFLRFNDRLYSLAMWVAGVSIAVMALIIPWGIFTRYVLGSGSQWPEPIAILLMVVFTFLGAAVSYRAGGHIAVAMLTDRLPATVQAVAARLVDFCMVAVAVFAVWYGTKLCIGLWGQSIGEIPWMPVGATYLPVPVGGLLTLVFIIERLLCGSQHERDIVRFDHEPAGNL